MNPRTLFVVGRQPVTQCADGSVMYVSEFTIDADGCPRAYGPPGTKPLDRLANAGHPGNWWGIATHNGEPSGRPIIQGASDPYPGMYVSTTAYKVPGYSNGDPRRELDSEKIAFMVAPRQLIRAVPGVVIGCKARVTDPATGRSVDGVTGDIGPSTHLGEGSMAAARGIGLQDDPRRGGSDVQRFIWEFWPGIPAPGFRLQSAMSARRLAVLDAVETATYVA